MLSGILSINLDAKHTDLGLKDLSYLLSAPP